MMSKKIKYNLLADALRQNFISYLVLKDYDICAHTSNNCLKYSPFKIYLGLQGFQGISLNKLGVLHTT